MEQGKSTFTIEYEIGRIRDFEKKILSGGHCGAFLPMSFVQIGQIEKANYDCSGYKAVASCEFANSKELMQMLERCVRMLLVCCEHLISPRRLELNTSTVFWSKPRNEVKLAYVPRLAPAERSTCVLPELAGHLERHIKDAEMYRYLRAVKEYVDQTNGSFYDILGCIGELRREIHACGWDGREET